MKCMHKYFMKGKNDEIDGKMHELPGIFSRKLPQFAEFFRKSDAEPYNQKDSYKNPPFRQLLKIFDILLGELPEDC